MCVLITYYHLLLAGEYDPSRPDMKTDENALPDIYVEEDLKRIKAKNKEIVRSKRIR